MHFEEKCPNQNWPQLPDMSSESLVMREIGCTVLLYETSFEVMKNTFHFLQMECHNIL